jgi:uncharacterized membrane protein YfcA
MEIMLVSAYLCAVLIGITLGLIGGGGSILTLPVFVYLLKFEPHLATSYSLFVVGVSSLFASFQNARKNLINYKTGLIFAAPALSVVYLIRKVVLPMVPEKMFQIGDFTVLKSVAIMFFFAVVMLLASYSMIKGRKEEVEKKEDKFNYPLILLQGFSVGIVTGLVGAGGGFLIIPALVFFAKLPMKEAVATSLMVISINSLIGFTGDLHHVKIDWQFLLIFSSLSILGIFIGIFLNSKINGASLRKGFGWFVLVMGIFVIFQEIYK